MPTQSVQAAIADIPPHCPKLADDHYEYHYGRAPRFFLVPLFTPTVRPISLHIGSGLTTSTTMASSAMCIESSREPTGGARGLAFLAAQRPAVSYSKTFSTRSLLADVGRRSRRRAVGATMQVRVAYFWSMTGVSPSNIIEASCRPAPNQTRAVCRALQRRAVNTTAANFSRWIAQGSVFTGSVGDQGMAAPLSRSTRALWKPGTSEAPRKVGISSVRQLRASIARFVCRNRRRITIGGTR